MSFLQLGWASFCQQDFDVGFDVLLATTHPIGAM